MVERAERVNSKQTPLEVRIATAINNTNCNSSTLAGLLKECEIAISFGEQKLAGLRTDVFDPEKFHDPRAARQLLEDSEFEVGRLSTLRPRLVQRLAIVEAAEQHDAWLRLYDEKKRQREEAADELEAAYVVPAERIAKALSKCVALDEELSQLHRSRPANEPLHLDGAELVARGLSEFTRDKPSLKEALVLPRWEGNGNLWPLKQRIDPTLYQIDGRRHPTDCGPEWWRQNLEQQKVKQEQQIVEEAQAQVERDRFWGRP